MTSSALDVRTLAISMGVGLGILLAVAIAIILVLIRQWKVRGRPFALATHLVQSSSFASTQGTVYKCNFTLPDYCIVGCPNSNRHFIS